MIDIRFNSLDEALEYIRLSKSKLERKHITIAFVNDYWLVLSS